MGTYSDWVRRLGSSTFNYWFGYVANGAWVAWLFSRATPLGPDPVGALPLLGYAAAGVLLWTFLEYVLHRYVYHVWPSFLRHGHGLHHQAPRELIGVPWWLTSVALYGVFRLLSLAVRPGPLGVVMGSCWLGYIGYCLLHHGSHHWAMRAPYLRTMKRMHQLHHAYPNTNWGFTTNIWDVAFGTYQADKRSGARRPRSAAPAERGTPHLSLQGEAPPH